MLIQIFIIIKIFTKITDIRKMNIIVIRIRMLFKFLYDIFLASFCFQKINYRDIRKVYFYDILEVKQI